MIRGLELSVLPAEPVTGLRLSTIKNSLKMRYVEHQVAEHTEVAGNSRPT